MEPEATPRRALRGRSASMAMALALVLAAACSTSVSLTPAPTGAPTTTAPGSFSPAGSLAEARGEHTATLLPDGRVLIVGGWADGTLASAELWDPASGSFAPTGSLAQPRKWHTATVLPDGRVLVIGGLGNDAGNEDDFLASAELWDPATGEFGPAASLADARIDHTATILSDGRVLVVGGILVSIIPLASAEIWDAASEAFGPTGSLADARSGHTATLLPDGRALVGGGGAFIPDGFDVRSSAELWDPASGAFGPTGTLAEARSDHTATLLPDGSILLAGGWARDAGGPVPLISAERWDPGAGSFAATGSLAEARSNHTVTLLPGGGVLVVGGGALTADRSDVHSSAELWDPATGSFAAAASLATARRDHTATLLPDGRVLVIGGVGDGGAPVASAEVYEPGR